MEIYETLSAIFFVISSEIFYLRSGHSVFAKNIEKSTSFKTHATLSQMNAARRWVRDALCD